MPRNNEVPFKITNYNKTAVMGCVKGMYPPTERTPKKKVREM